MNTIEKPAALGRGQTGLITDSGDKSTKNPRIRKGSKIYGVLYALAEGRSLNRFEAERQLNDHTLNSTISEIQNRLGVLIHRESEKVLCLGGTKKVDVMRYRLLPDQQHKVQQLLGRVV